MAARDGKAHPKLDPAAAATVPPQLLSLAENPNTHQPLGPDQERIENDRFVLWMGRSEEPPWNVVQRLRLRPDELDRTIAEVHAILRDRGRGACSWEVGGSATPPDLVERLLARGLTWADDPHVLGMLLRSPPPAVEGIEARPARDAGEYAAALAVARQAFGVGSEEQDEAQAEALWRSQQDYGHSRRFVALIDDRIVGCGSSVYADGAVTLYGGAVLPEARGHGVYRALVRARWDDAVARGRPALVTQAGRMSAPILARLGFVAVARIEVLEDRFG